MPTQQLTVSNFSILFYGLLSEEERASEVYSTNSIFCIVHDNGRFIYECALETELRSVRVCVFLCAFLAYEVQFNAGRSAGVCVCVSV